MDECFFDLLRVALGESREFSYVLTAQDWASLYTMASKQSLLGVAYHGITKLPKDRQPSFNVAFQWASEAETVRGQNALLNREAARLTRLFESEGRKCAILKGPANARLYPDAFMRQCGDIDIWVDGGRDAVRDLLRRKGLLEDDVPTDDPHEIVRRFFSTVSSHHFHLSHSAAEVNVEVHFRPSSGNLNPFTNRRLQRFLAKEIENTELVPEGFRVPSMKFALVMQLSHIQRHFIDGGIGLRQVMDYYMLLTHATGDDREHVAKLLRELGLYHTGAALMWILGHVFGLDRSKMLCAPCAKRGQRVLGVIMDGGNFGRYAKKPGTGAAPIWIHNRTHVFRMLSFDVSEAIWHEISYWKLFVRTIPLRIRLRRVSIREFF